MMNPDYIQAAKAEIEKAKKGFASQDERKQSTVALAAAILSEANRIQTPDELQSQKELAQMMDDPSGKFFTISLTDQCFRSKRASRIANQIVFNLKKFGIPQYLNKGKKTAFYAFKWLGKLFSPLLVPLTKSLIRKKVATVILPGEENKLNAYLLKRQQEGIRINLNHLGEAILGENEAQNRLNVYLQDLKNRQVEYISIKISTIFSQIHLQSFDDTVRIISERLKTLYQASKEHLYTCSDGRRIPKFVNLDMEEYKDLLLTVAAFRKTLDEPEFFNYYAGIVLQSYLPDSYLIQQELTVWAMQRVARGGAPIKIRLVKGANLAMEQVEAALKNWPQAPYKSKAEVDANFIRMLTYGTTKEHAKAAHIGVASHNLFDIAYALLLQAENQISSYISFEMLEGMADPVRRVVQKLCKEMLLYCPCATEEEFQNAVAYLLRRLDENTAPDNFLRYIFHLSPQSKAWADQQKLFEASLDRQDVSISPRKFQNRLQLDKTLKLCAEFENEADTDWALPQNRVWLKEIVQKWENKKLETLPLASLEQINQIVETASQAFKKWNSRSSNALSVTLAEVARKFRQSRGDLIGVMMAETKKTAIEADVEISEAIDFIEYYRAHVKEWHSLEDLQWQPKGVVLIASPWNFPCSIPVGGIASALTTGNAVIFKPPPEAVQVGFLVANIFWQAGISSELLQFVNCEDEPQGSALIQHPLINKVILTGATDTAKKLLSLRPALDLSAETGGKNAMIITSMADRDLAIKDLIQSAFGHSGQKCSACSIAILEAEVYDDPHFHRQLKDAAASLTVGSPWDLATKVNPLIRTPDRALLRGLVTLDEGEEWLLKPQEHPQIPNLWSPGIKMGVKEKSFTHQTELFGPVLALMRAKDLNHAIEIANQTPYGLTAGIHTLDEREQTLWLEKIEAGNCYINRTITGAIVQRQPFGGCKASSFGRGAKAGGPNYVTQLMTPKVTAYPKEGELPPKIVETLKQYIPNDQHALWDTSVRSFTFYYHHYFSKDHDPTLLQGQDNFLRYVPRKDAVIYTQPGEKLQLYLAIAAALICHATVRISGSEQIELPQLPDVTYQQESEAVFIEWLKNHRRHLVRTFSPPSDSLKQHLAKLGIALDISPVISNGRLELLHDLREVSISKDYHRYGNLGEREAEKRKEIL